MLAFGACTCVHGACRCMWHTVCACCLCVYTCSCVVHVCVCSVHVCVYMSGACVCVHDACSCVCVCGCMCPLIFFPAPQPTFMCFVVVGFCFFDFLFLRQGLMYPRLTLNSDFLPLPPRTGLCGAGHGAQGRVCLGDRSIWVQPHRLHFLTAFPYYQLPVGAEEAVRTLGTPCVRERNRTWVLGGATGWGGDQ